MSDLAFRRPTQQERQAYRASILHFVADPGLFESDQQACVSFSDGLLIVADGKIEALGNYPDLAPELDCPLIDYRGKWIMPGFIDTHVHYPQSEMIASPAASLLPWLETYTFPTERKFAEFAHASRVANFFLDQIVRSGTTTAMVYCTVHPASVDAFFEASATRNLRMVAGKVLMDRNCPEFLRDSAEQGVLDSEALIQRWHGKGRALYAITPRFAPTSSAAQLQLAGELACRYPTTFLQTHVAENLQEVAWVKELFPAARSYLDVYEGYQMLRPRAMYGHCLWLDEVDRQRMAQSGASAAACPSSNFFLGSGLFDFAKAEQAAMQYTLASDIGGGTSPSMLQTMQDAYKAARMNGCYLPAMKMFYLATLGAARSMQLDDVLGNFAPGKEADFIVLDPNATPLLKQRHAQCNRLEDMLFMLALLGDERSIAATFSAGVCLHRS